MTHTLFNRRQLLYFGLGAAGAISKLAPSAIAAASVFPRSKAMLKPSVISSPTASVPSRRSQLPEFQDIQQWLNSPPLTASSLKGNVVLVQLWTFACINCQRTLPYITRWHEQYAAQGLKVIGVHTPEFSYERDIKNIQAALKQHQITYPVAVDNQYKTWKAYDNEYWPHLFLADRSGTIRYDHIGEGAYSETEQMIRQLLG